MIGKSLAHYQILDSLGEGGMGSVYLALDTRLDRKVALKLLRTEVEASPVQLARIKREAKATAALNHPGVVTIFAVEEAEGIIFITMEHVPGRTLEELIDSGEMNEATFRDLAGQIAAAVGAAHAAGITHRDLKPGNVMIDAHGRVKVLDFGLAQMDLPKADGADLTGTLELLTQPGTLMGTLPYMSPEQVCGEPADARSDVFSLGVVFYQMASGQRPFRGKVMPEMAYAIMHIDPTPLAESRPGFPEELNRIIAKCLKKEPAERYADARELARALVEGEAEPESETAAKGDSLPLFGVADFRNISRDSAADWLSTGVAETVNVDLTKLPGVQTLARDQIVAAWSGLESGDDTAVLATTRRLGLDYLITGAFQKHGERIRITGQILDVRRNIAAGSVKLDGSMGEIFNLQDQVLAGLLAEANLSFTDSRIGGSRPRSAVALQAYENYSRAKAKLLDMGAKAFEEAEDLLREALRLDPDYALAHTAFGHMRAMRFITTTDKRDLKEALEHLEKASKVDPELDEPWVWRAYCLGRLDRFEEAIAAGKRGITLNPARPQAHYFTGVSYWMRGASHYQTGDWEEAARHLSRSVQLQPTFQPGFMALFDVHFRLGRWEEARRNGEMAAEVEASGKWEVSVFCGAETQLGILDLAEGDIESAERRFQVSDQRLAANVHFYAPLYQAMNYWGWAGVALARNEHEKALEMLRKAREIGERHPRTLGMGRVLVKVGYGQAAALARSGKLLEAEMAFKTADHLFRERDSFDFSGVWQNMDSDLLMDCAKAWEALGQPEKAAKAGKLAVAKGWPQ